jgi:predicted DNA-binding transcriptional regulator AlpA
MSTSPIDGTSPQAGDDARSNANSLLTADDLSLILRVPRSWIYSHLDLLPTIRLGRYVRFRGSEVDRFLTQQKTCE